MSSLPSKPPKLPDQYDRRALEAAFNQLYDAFEQGQSYVVLYMHNAEPERMVGNMVVLADGTNWNPGSGRGLYRRTPNNVAWTFIG